MSKSKKRETDKALVERAVAAELRAKVLEMELAKAKEISEWHEKGLSEELEARDARDEWAVRLASALGCHQEWSSAHDHYECIETYSRQLLRFYERQSEESP